VVSGLPDGTKRCAIPWPVEKLGVMEPFDSSTTPLAGNGVWTSTIDSTGETAMIYALCYSDVDGTLEIQESGDGTNWLTTYTSPIWGTVGGGVMIQKMAKYTRVRYVNGAVAQTTFWIYVNRRYKVIAITEAK